MKQKLLIAQGELSDAYKLARSNRPENNRLSKRILYALDAVNDSILILKVLENRGNYAN